MSRQLSLKGLEVSKYGTNISYLLKDGDVFSAGEYRMLCNIKEDHFISCIKTWFNGFDQLIYKTQGYSSVKTVLDEMREEGFVRIAQNLLAAVHEIQNNSFLSCINIEASIDRIFVDSRSMAVKFIYLPVRTGLYRDPQQFEHLLRTGIIKAMMDRGFVSGFCASLLSDLKNSSRSIVDIYSDLQKKRESTLYLKGTGSLAGEEYKVDKDEFVIGRSRTGSDAVLEDNKSVGRIHCRFIKKKEGYFLEDLGSINGTSINNDRLVKGEPVRIKEGDIIGVSDVKFQAVFR